MKAEDVQEAAVLLTNRQAIKAAIRLVDQPTWKNREDETPVGCLRWKGVPLEGIAITQAEMVKLLQSRLDAVEERLTHLQVTY